MPSLTITIPEIDGFPPWSCYRIDLKGHPENREETESRDKTDPAEERALLRRICSASITTAAQAVSRAGRHEHVFFNPAGITFEVRCFSNARGCSPQGDPTSAFTWFAGYRWRYAICATCLTHLGWQFQSDSDLFWGLIANRLME